jgi:hypothetical protein
MKMKSKRILITSVLGFLIHTSLWTSILGIENVIKGSPCEDGSCWALIALDIPVSAIYAENVKMVTFGSLTVGGVYWALLFVLVTEILAIIYRKISKKHQEPNKASERNSEPLRSQNPSS